MIPGSNAKNNYPELLGGEQETDLVGSSCSLGEGKKGSSFHVNSPFHCSHPGLSTVQGLHTEGVNMKRPRLLARETRNM